MTDAEKFVERFSEVWAAPEPDRFADLWAPDGQLLHPGMDASIGRDEIPRYMARLKAIAPDIALRVTRWAAKDDFVLIEWILGASLGDERLEWSGVDRFTLRGDHAVEGIAWFDTMPLWRRLDPERSPQGTLEDAAAAAASRS
jgi:uncharacterized protein (TIGR02246 family)